MGALSTRQTNNLSNYARYRQADFNRPEHYPLEYRPDPALYRPAAPWIGRLILPSAEESHAVMGALLEIHHAPADYQRLVGQVVRLRWEDTPFTNARMWGVTRQVVFDKTAEKNAAQGYVLAERVNNWFLVNPFESLAGSHPYDDIIVRLPEPVVMDGSPQDGGPAIFYIPRAPSEITGRYYALVRFVKPVDGEGERLEVAHYNRQTREFDGPREVVRLPAVVPNSNNIKPAANEALEQSPGNEAGWYIYGAQGADGVFVVQALAPRALLRLRPDEVIAGGEATNQYLKPKSWRAGGAKGSFTSALLCPDGTSQAAAVESWREGDQALVVHLYGGIGGPQGEPAARTPFYWGHFSFGIAHVVREPLAGELIFDIDYHQVYVHNRDGLTSSTLHWTRYTGDRQYGWLATRPIQDVLIKLDCFTEDFVVGNLRRSALTQLVFQLELMTARYRIADGHGSTQITAANNCAQDSNQALYAAIRGIDRTVRTRPDFQTWKEQNPAGAERMVRLLALGEELRRTLMPFRSARADWETGMTSLGSTLNSDFSTNLGLAIRSWRTMLPSLAARYLAQVFAKHGAMLWVLRTNQVGGHDPGIAPYIPNV